MVRPRTLRLLAAAFAASAAAQLAHAQAAANPVLINPNPAPKRNDAPPAAHAISPEVASQLQAAAPKYNPPPPKPAKKPDEEEVDARDLDKPRNGIIRLNRIIVKPMTPFITPQAVNTDKGAKDIAMRKYISEVDRAMNRFTIPLFGQSMEQRAMAMYQEDERLKNISDTRDMARMVGSSDSAQGSYILKESQKTFMRTSDFGWNGGGPR